MFPDTARSDGQPIPQGETNCPYCTVSKLVLKLSREGVLAASFILLPIFFTLTGFITRSFHAKEQALAQEWFAGFSSTISAVLSARSRWWEWGRCSLAFSARVEVSGSYSAILPVMISNTIAYLISRRCQPTALFDLLAQQDGMTLPSMEERRDHQILRVEDAMQPTGVTLEADDLLADALSRTKSANEEYFLVRHRGSWMALAKSELEKHAGQADTNMHVRDLPSRGPLPFLYPDQSLEEAMGQIGDWPIVPVLNRARLEYLEGVISLADILLAYREAAKT